MISFSVAIISFSASLYLLAKAAETIINLRRK